MAKFPPTDHKGVVERVNRNFPDLLRKNTKEADNEFLMRVVNEPELLAEGWGLLSKPNPGTTSPNGFTYPQSYLDTLPPGWDKDGEKVAVDVIALPDGNRVDVINGGDNHPTPGGPAWNPIAEYDADGNLQWRSSDTYVSVAGWPIFNSGTGSVAANIARLGCSWFCAIAAWKKWPQEAQPNFDWIEKELNPDFYRVILDLNGIPHLSAGQEDFWVEAGCDITAPGWDADFHRMMDKFVQRGKKVWLTLSGSVTHWDTPDKQRRNIETFVRAMNAGQLWPYCELVECGNEYEVNKWTDELLMSCGSILASMVPAGTVITLSSPTLAHGTSSADDASNEEMADSERRIYGKSDHSGATFCTVHINRDRNSKWSHPAAYNGIKTFDGWTLNLDYGSGEPAGPGASAGGDENDPVALCGDYKETSEAGWKRYVQHHAWGVFNGHLPDQYKEPHDVKFIWEHPNMQAISNGMRDYRAAEPSKPPKPVGEMHGGDTLKPEESIWSVDGLADLHYQGDGNLVTYLDDGEGGRDPVWSSNTGGTKPGQLQMQEDGNLVLIDGDGNAIRATRTDGHPGAMVQLQGDANFVLYLDPKGPDAGTPIWASATDKFYGPEDDPAYFAALQVQKL